MNQAVKVLRDTPTGFVVGGYGVVWGGRDLAGEFFTKATDFWFDRLTETPPVLYQHGMDDSFGKTVIGKVTTKTVDDVGLWIEAQIDTHQKYADAIKPLVLRGVVGWSSGAPAHLVEKDSSGKIKSWPVAEWSLTPTPCEPRTLGVTALRSFAEVAPAIKTFLDIKAELDAAARDDLSDSDFAYIDSNGGKHLPIHDAAHVRNALARFNQTHFESADAKAKAKAKIVARAHALGVDVSDDSSKALMEGDDTAGGYASEMHTHLMGTADEYRHAHAHRHMPNMPNHDGTDHGHPIQKEPDADDAMKAIAALIGPIALEVQFIEDRLTAFSASTKGLLERRTKEGREFSTRNEAALMAHADRLCDHAGDCTEMAGTIRGMVDASRMARDSRTKAEHSVDPETLKAEFALLDIFMTLHSDQIAS